MLIYEDGDDRVKFKKDLMVVQPSEYKNLRNCMEKVLKKNRIQLHLNRPVTDASVCIHLPIPIPNDCRYFLSLTSTIFVFLLALDGFIVTKRKTEMWLQEQDDNTCGLQFV